jgi:hypothetical protein
LTGRERVVRSHLIAQSLLAGLVVPAFGLAAGPRPLITGLESIGIRLVAPAPGAGDDPLGRSYIVARLAPGTSIRRSVEISNSTRSNAKVAVYPAAAGLSRGRFGFAPGKSRNELSRWTSVSRPVLRLPAGEKASETLTITVPKNASSGERYAVVWAQVSAPAPATGGVTLVNRVGVRIYLSIGPGGAPPASFAIGRVTATRAANGDLLVVAPIHNGGGRTLDIGGTLSLSNGPGGLRAGPFPVRLGTVLAPHTTEPGIVRLDRRLPLGPWRAQIQLASGQVLRSAVATITFPRPR